VSAAISARPARHPWMGRFLADPGRAYADLIGGFADIHPYERADAPDIARLLFADLDPDDPARMALDVAVLAWLEAWRRATAPSRPGPYQNWVRQFSETVEIAYILRLPRTAVALRRRRLVWEDACARHVIATSRDARAALWRAMALTQRLAHETDPGIPAHGLLPLWHTICREAGGALPPHYLSLGLLGLRRLPNAEGDMPWLAGLAHWALAREPSTAAFRAEWHALKALYPKNPSIWRREVTQLLDTEQFRTANIDPPGWWGEADPDLRARPAAANQRAPDRLRSPGPETSRAILERCGEPFVSIKPEIDTLLAAHRRFRDATGDPQYFVRIVHRLGSALIDRRADAPHDRARLAESLAREALAWAPYDGFLWSVWHRALVAQGRLEAAEHVGWEAMRRNPDKADGYTQLAHLLARLPPRRFEAAALLREAIERFPANVPARTQLAELLIAQDRAEEADAVIADAFASDAIDAVSFAIRARLRAHAGDGPGAGAAVEAGLRLDPQNGGLLDLRVRLARGAPLPLVANDFTAPPPAASAQPEPDDDIDLRRATAYGRLRRLRFRQDHAGEPGIPAPEEARPVAGAELAPDYAELLTFRARATGPAAMPGFAVAFEAALRQEDRAVLEQLAQRQPRLEALTWLARALLGDALATARVEAWLVADLDRHAAPAVRGLYGALRLVGGTSSTIGNLVQNRRTTILRLVHDATEATLGDALLAA
jgi:tetratricopeptide (TPR) repeat protein